METQRRIPGHLGSGLLLPCLLLGSGLAQAVTQITELTANPSQVPPNVEVAFNITLTTEAVEFLSGSATFTLLRDGSPVFQDTASGYLDSLEIMNGQVVDAFTFDTALYSTPGDYTLEVAIEGFEDGEVPVSDVAATGFSVVAAVVPTQLSVSTLEISGVNPGETASGTFQVVEGEGPFSFSAGLGSLSPASGGSNETITYSYTLPADSTPGSQIEDSVTVTPAAGDPVTLPVTISVASAPAPEPTPEPEPGPVDQTVADAIEAVAQTDSQRTYGRVIGTVCPSGSAAGTQLQEDCNALAGAALSGDPALAQQAGQALGQITTDQAGASVDAAQTSIQGQLRNVGGRVAALRQGASGFGSGLALNIDGQMLPIGQLAQALGRQLGGAAGDGGLLGSSRLGVFLNGTIGRGDRDGTQNVSGFDFDSYSVTLGVDYRFQPHLVGGVALGYATGETDFDSDRGTLDSDDLSLSLYGTYYQETGLYIDGILTRGRADYEQRRNIRYTLGGNSVDQVASADFDGSQWLASLGGGYSLNRGALSFGPTLRVEYIHTAVDAFEESMSNPGAAGGGWATRIDEQTLNSFTSQLGFEAAYAVGTSWGVLMPNLMVDWVHEFRDNAGDVTGFFLQDSSRTAFALKTEDLDQNYFNVRLGVSAQFAGGSSAYLYYRQLLGYDDLDAYTVGAGLRFEF